jgi:hypothetical protein
MSPSDAPLSEEPYCSTASFSSAISRALIDSPDGASFVDVGHAHIDLVADLEALGALFGPVAGQVGAADEGLHAVVIDLDAAILDRGDLHGDDRAALHAAMASANGSPSSALIDSEMRSFSVSTSVTTALTMSPLR